MKKLAHLILFFCTTFQVYAQTNTLNLDSSNRISKDSSAYKKNWSKIRLNSTDDIILSRYVDQHTLYYGCQNQFQILLPNSKKKYFIQCMDSLNGVPLISIEKDSFNSSKGVYSLIPIDHRSRMIARIGVYNNKNKLVRQFNFQISAIPLVELFEQKLGWVGDFNKRGGVINILAPMSVFKFEAKSTSSEFTTFCPKDNRYVISDMNVMLVKNKRLISSIQSTNGEVDIKEFIEIIRRDTIVENYRLVFEVGQVNRINYKNELLNCRVGTSIFNIYFYKD